MMHETKWNFSIGIGNNHWDQSGIITRSKDYAAAEQRISLKVHQFVNQLIESAKEGTLEIKQPNPEPPRKTFSFEWTLTIKNDEIEWYPRPSALRNGTGRRTVLESLIRVKKSIRGKI